MTAVCQSFAGFYGTLLPLLGYRVGMSVGKAGLPYGSGQRGIAGGFASLGSPHGRWVTIERKSAYVHVFVGPRGMITRGPDPLLGVPYAQVARLAHPRHAATHPNGERPVGFNAHPRLARFLMDLEREVAVHVGA